ncbi:MAG: peptidoglycan-binding protein [Oscillospiraceae bacterium]|nr:peptidoglycan-binding protein [Oscillospiraceae bacterium]
MAEGYLVVRLKTAREALPVTGEIEIVGTAGGGEGIANTFLTDESGVTARITLPAPEASVSLDPDATELPYGVYTLIATADGYRTVVIQGVQIYSGIEADQDIEMLPYYSDGVRTGEEIPTDYYTIPEPAIRTQRQSGNGPIDECNDEEEPDPAVLSSVYIPEKITVHLGTPASNARNETVNFAYYIKNVCSSEIYPTWPENAIRANVYAQISLALNRVFTEWYLSKGYSFQITNSTQYDQYYVSNRTIYSNISNIVDDIFNVYLRRVGDFAPYYAEYCNGTTATCPGMSQWGTVTLANSGYTPIRILRYYYGSNFELVTTNDIRAIESSYPGSPLSLGSTGNNVRIIQRQLSRIGRNYPAIGTLTVDGVFGAATQSAVRTFQRVFNLTQDGIVGKRTWYQISYIYVAVKRLAELGSENEPYPDYGSGSGGGGGSSNSLRVGSSGKEVAWLQYRLSYLAATYYPSIPDWVPDGVFGEQTRAAVVAFQNLFGLTADGIAGTRTLSELDRRFEAAYEDNNPGSFFGAYPGLVLRLGDRGLRTKQMQFYLLYLSYVYSAIPRIRADGIFGNDTRNAVIAFQNRFGLTADGVVGLQTWSKMVSVFNETESNLLEQEETPGTYGGRVLSFGSSGMNVMQLQQRLWAISRQYQGIYPVFPDGEFGEDTTRSVRQFQREFGLDETGFVDRRTWERINEIYNMAQMSGDDDCRFVDVPYPGSPLSLGDTGVNVRVAAYYIWFVSRFNLALDPPDGVTNVFNRQMEENVRSFQKTHNLEETGVIDEETWKDIYEQYAADYRVAYPECDGIVEEIPTYSLYPGSSGARVANLQRIIDLIAAYYCGVPYVEVNGDYDEETENAVMILQTILELESTGFVDPMTWEIILEIFETLQA